MFDQKLGSLEGSGMFPKWDEMTNFRESVHNNEAGGNTFGYAETGEINNG